MSSPLRLPLGDEFWFLSHREYGPGARIAPKVLGYGLAGALIAELILLGLVELHDDRVAMISRAAEEPPRPGPAGAARHAMRDPGVRRVPPAATQVDPVISVMMTELGKRPALYPVRDWLDFFCDEADRRVAQRLEAAGHVQAAGMLRRRYEPVDTSTASSPAVRLRYVARNLGAGPDGIDVQTAILAGLTLATNLTPEIDVDYLGNLQDCLLDMVSSLDQRVLPVLSAVDKSVSALPLQPKR